MDSEEFEKRMRALEYFHSVRVLPGAWTIVRVDGRSFSRFTATVVARFPYFAAAPGPCDPKLLLVAPSAKYQLVCVPDTPITSADPV
jgi:hypothetical protein